MRVAWVSHQWPSADGTYVGGAEFIQHEMRKRAPDGVDIVECGPHDIDVALSCDRIVVAGFEMLPEAAVGRLDGKVDVLWLMSPPQQHLRPLMDSCGTLVWASDGMRQHYRSEKGVALSGSWDTSVLPECAEKLDVAVWAARDVSHKGRANARSWAEERGIRLLEFSGRPRSEVLAAMAQARWFVHLPNDPFDPCPTTVIEAEILGCEIVVNDLVGRTPVRGNGLREHIEGNAEIFWGFV